MHRPSRAHRACWVVGMIDRPDENDLVALFRPTRFQLISHPSILLSYARITPTWRLTTIFRETIFSGNRREKPSDFYLDRSRLAATIYIYIYLDDHPAIDSRRF